MKRKLVVPVVFLLGFCLAWTATPGAAGGEEIPRMTKEELKPLLGNPEVVVLDVRLGGRNAPTRIPGAAYEDPGNVGDWSSRYPKDKRIVLYCT